MEIAAGVDVSKDRLDVYLHPSGERLAVGNDGDGIAALIGWLAGRGAQAIGFEATGGYEKGAVLELAAAGLPVIVVNPAHVRHFILSKGQRAKTDLIDAAMIARFLVANVPQLRPLPDEQTLLLADLMARRRQLQAMLVAEKSRHARALGRVKQSVVRIVEALNSELAALDADLDTTIKAVPVWRDKENLLTSVPGVGKIIARTLLAALPELGQLDRRAIAALCGLAPYTRQSGTWRGNSFIAGGRAVPRSAMFIAAMVAARHDPTLKAFRDRLVAAGKPKKLALIATARKLLTILNAIIRDQKPWQAT